MNRHQPESGTPEERLFQLLDARARLQGAIGDDAEYKELQKAQAAAADSRRATQKAALAEVETQIKELKAS